MSLLQTFKQRARDGMLLAAHERDVKCLVPRSLVLLRPKAAFARWVATHMGSRAPSLPALRRLRVPYLVPQDVMPA